jgi:hypothetical protein
MVCAVFVRRLREGVSFEDFRGAWEPEGGFGVPTTVWHARRLDDEREILSVGLVDVELADAAALMERVGAAEARRHESIEGVIEATTFRGLYEVVAEADLS